MLNISKTDYNQYNKVHSILYCASFSVGSVPTWWTSLSVRSHVESDVQRLSLFQLLANIQGLCIKPNNVEFKCVKTERCKGSFFSSYLAFDLIFLPVLLMDLSSFVAFFFHHFSAVARSMDVMVCCAPCRQFAATHLLCLSFSLLQQERRRLESQREEGELSRVAAGFRNRQKTGGKRGDGEQVRKMGR